MHVDIVDTIEKFQEIKADWDQLYMADPDAEFYLSWAWLRNWLDVIGTSWFVLAAKSDVNGKYVGFFPLRFRTRERQGQFAFTEIITAGSYAADYTGFLADPDVQSAAARAFSAALRRMRWARFMIENASMSPERLDGLLGGFPSYRYRRRQLERINTKDNIDNCICPYVDLPASWDEYLETKLSTNTRQKARRFLRQLDRDEDIRIVPATNETWERDIRILLGYWKRMWGERKGGRIRNILSSNYTTLTRCHEAGLVLLPVLWKGETPLGAHLIYVDEAKRRYLFYMGARDESVNSPPPGLLLHAYAIRQAIQQGFTRYDFLRGNEPYKYSYGPVERRVACISLTHAKKALTSRMLDLRSVPVAVARAGHLHKEGRLTDAERRYRQVLEVDTDNEAALYGLSQILLGKGDARGAVGFLARLVELRPSASRAWHALGLAQEAVGKFEAAEAAYRRVVVDRPERFEGHYRLACVLIKLGHRDEAIAVLRQALAIRPDHLGAKSRLAAAGAVSIASVSIKNGRKRPFPNSPLLRDGSAPSSL